MPKSSGKFSAKREAMTYRAFFKARWQTFLHASFDGPEEVAHVFGVDATSARNWWDGLNAPSGFAVGYAFMRYPEQASQALRESA